MGQAKRRGTTEQRTSQAIAKNERLKPAYIVCNRCQAEIADVMTMPTKGLRDIDAVFAAHCPQCKSSTWAIKGTPSAVEAFYAVMAETMAEDGDDGELLVGSQGTFK